VLFSLLHPKSLFKVRTKTITIGINILTKWSQALSKIRKNSVIYLCNNGHIIVGSFSAHFPILLGKNWLR
jgi:hypothetical protein